LDGRFINAYRSQLPYDATGANPAARLTIDLAAGDRYLIGLCQTATANWLTTSSPVLDYANAMVPNKQPGTSAAESNWQEHINGEPQYSPPIGPLAPAKFTGSLYIVTGRNPAPECTNFSASLENSTGAFVETVAPNGLGPRRACWAICFGQRNVRGRGRSARLLRIHVRAEWVWGRRRITFQFRCRPCGSSEVRYQAAIRKSHDFRQESIAEMIFEFSCPPSR